LDCTSQTLAPRFLTQT